MNTYNTFLIFLLIFILCSCKSSPSVITSQEKNNRIGMVQQIMDEWHEAASKSDFNAYFDLIAADGIFIGTDASEIWTKSEFETFAKPYFDQGKAWDFKTQFRHVYLSQTADIAWFDELLTTWMGECRGSGVLSWDSENNRYNIEQYVLSVTIPNENIQDVISINKEEK